MLLIKNSNPQEGPSSKLGCIKRMSSHTKYQTLDCRKCLSSGCVTNEYCRDNSYMDLSLNPRVYDTSLSLNPIFSQFSTPVISPSTACSKYVNVFLSLSHHSPPNPTTSGTWIIAESPTCLPLHPSHHFPCLQSILHIADRSFKR